MQIDATNQIFTTIKNNVPIQDKVILDIGCGDGKNTRLLAKFAKRIIAIDADRKLIQTARMTNNTNNTKYIVMKSEDLDFQCNSVDLVIFILSLHHLPERCENKNHSPLECMEMTLRKTIEVIKDDGKIVIIEPGLSGSFIDMEEQFCIGDGNEMLEKKFAQESISVLNSKTAWKTIKSVRFKSLFYFEDFKDVVKNLKKTTDINEQQFNQFLNQHRNGSNIILDAERKMYVITKTKI